MPIDPVKIPQNVYVEDRIIGSVTLRQIIISLLGTGLSYALWSGLQKTSGGQSIVFGVLAWLPALISIVFAFVRINDISMFRICLLLLERMDKPSVRTWSPRSGIIINIRTKPGKNIEEKEKKVPHNEAEEHLTQLSAILDKGPEEEIVAQEAQPEKRPVEKSRVRADAFQSPSIDNITAEEPEDPPSASGFSSLIRDIHPAH